MTIRRLLSHHLLILLAAFVSVSALADSADAVADDAMKQLDRMVDIILTVKDKPSAEKAVADIKGVIEELKKIGTRAKAVAQPTPEMKAQIQAKLQAKAEEFKKRIADAKEQFAKAGLEASAVLAKGLMEMSSALRDAMQAFEQPEK